MNSNLTKGLLVLSGLLLGAGANSLLSNKNYVTGRLSACRDITASINAQLPAGLTCTRSGNEVYISTPMAPGVQFTLDGRQVPAAE